jgi:hypothetical protein
MNTSQRIVLIVGAIALLWMLFSVGEYQQGENGVIFQPNTNHLFANIWDWHSAIIKGAIISIATAAVYFAVGKIKQ